MTELNLNRYEIVSRLNKEYIQNDTNWCWAVACKIVGEQYKRMNSDYDSQLYCTQRNIVMNANTIMPRMIGNFPGDDEAKIRGIKYVVTGDCNSDKIKVRNLGKYDMKENLLNLYGEKIFKVLRSKNFIIGNAILLPNGICHSFVLMGMAGNMILIYDPWDGSIHMCDILEVFEKGFISARGIGVIKWIQFIDNNTQCADIPICRGLEV